MRLTPAKDRTYFCNACSTTIPWYICCGWFPFLTHTRPAFIFWRRLALSLAQQEAADMVLVRSQLSDVVIALHLSSAIFHRRVALVGQRRADLPTQALTNVGDWGHNRWKVQLTNGG